MAATASTMLPLGTHAPEFSLPDTVSGRTVSLSDFHGKGALLVIFLCNHCPYVIHVRDELVRIGKDYAGKDVGIVAISANDPGMHSDDAPERLGEVAREVGYAFPVLFDETQEVAKAYHAACTPDFFLFDTHRKLVYRGQLDDSRPGNDVPVTGKDLREALEAMLEGAPVSGDQKPSLGCNIKWRPGNEP